MKIIIKMKFYRLCNYDDQEWDRKKSALQAFSANKLQDLSQLLSEFTQIDPNEINNSLLYLKNFNDEQTLVNLINEIVKYALKIPDLIPSGKIQRLTRASPKIEFKRKQILCIICHMFLCTLEKDKNTLYWVTFDIWLNFSTKCTNSYLQTLIEYFRESFNLINDNDYMNETIRLEGSIGDCSEAEIDFANMDIGYGKTGTQEEILFAASPEISYANDSFDVQIKGENVLRELKKCLVGFSAVSGSAIETGHWGCGCFNGHKYLKALVQWIAASCTHNKIVFYCFTKGDFEQEFLNFKTMSPLIYYGITLDETNFLKKILHDLKELSCLPFLSLVKLTTLMTFLGDVLPRLFRYKPLNMDNYLIEEPLKDTIWSRQQ
ncbi:poly(ADP-ribose) glycohydrolase-like [Brachionus plicatilis]|uniref:poly(ADP-ribose) glycohydrolase n=1 Tax=Brachionus plicatilis TaxID=10195 RepID=A0A3M7T980_BRAPC|nr:poly(ADP-ribose) glycohydrolase-like [Brachionus plicatilis]